MQESLRCVIYARKSTDTEDKQILSIPAQLDELREFAARAGLVITDELTESCSAREPGRPVFSHLLRDVAAGRIPRILSWKLDRLARNSVDGGALIYHLGKGHLHEIVTPEGTYTGAGDSKFMLAVLFGAATKMTDDLSQGVKRGNKAIFRRGRITGLAPLGYIKVRDRGGFRGAGKVVPDPERFALVERLWQTILMGNINVADLWRRASTEWGLTTRGRRNAPGGPVKLSHLYLLFKNHFYAGDIVRGGEVYPGEHPPMVTRAEFERVQELIGPRNAARPSRHGFLYRQFLRCGHCEGRLLTGETHVNRYGYRYTYYRCGRRRPGYPRCKAPMISEEDATRDVLAALERISIPKRVLEWALEAVDWWVEQEKDQAHTRVRAAKQELETTEKKLVRLREFLIAGTLTEQEYVSDKATELARIASLKAMIVQPMQELEAWQRAVEDVFDFGKTASARFQSGSEEERRTVLSLLCPHLVVTDRKAAPLLLNQCLLLEELNTLVSNEKPGYPHLPPPQRIWPTTAKNARPRNARERAFRGWWSKLHDVRTFDRQDESS